MEFLNMKKQNVMSKWLFFYEQRDDSGLLWITFAGCALASLCVFAGFSAVQLAIERAEEFRNTAHQQTGAPLFVSKYSVTQLLVLGIEGVKYQLCIALALIIRWSGLFAYRCCGFSARRKWLAIVIAEVSLILAVSTFAWYSWLSYRVLDIETVCNECMSGSSGLLGSTTLWTSLLSFVMLIQTIYGVARLVLPLIDALRAKGARSVT
jgi:hypothetical protein